MFTGHFTGQCGKAMAAATQLSQLVVRWFTVYWSFHCQCGKAMAKATQSVVSGLLFAGHFTGQCGNATAKAEQSKQSVGRFSSSSVMVSHFTGQCENALAVGHTRPQRLLVNPPHACAVSTNKGWTVATTGQEVQSHCQALATKDLSLSSFGGVSTTTTEPRVKRTEEDYSLTQSPGAV